MSAFLFEIVFLSHFSVMNTWFLSCFFCMLLRCPPFFMFRIYSVSFATRVRVYSDLIKLRNDHRVEIPLHNLSVNILPLSLCLNILFYKNWYFANTPETQNREPWCVFLKDVTWKELNWKSMNKSIYYLKNCVSTEMYKYYYIMNN